MKYSTNTFLEKNQRITYIDYIRAFCIILMIMGHIGFGSVFSLWIHAFHMPIWFFISGYFCKINRSLKEYAVKKIKNILVPYFIFAVIYIFVFRVLEKQWCWEGILFPNKIQVPINGAIWFLPAFFITDLICYLSFKFLPRLSAVALLACVGIIGSFSIICLPFSCDSALVGSGFFLCGFLCRKYLRKLLELSVGKTIILGIASNIVIFINSNVNMRENIYGIVPLFWLAALSMIVFLFNIFIIIMNTKENKFFKYIGQNTIIFICTNQLILFLIEKIIYPHNSIVLLCWKIFELVTVTVVGSFLDYTLRKTPLKIIIGK